MTERCPTCCGERRVYSCWDEAKCPMAQDEAIRQHAVARENFHTMQLAADKLRQRAEAAEKERDAYLQGVRDADAIIAANKVAAERETASLKARLEEAGKVIEPFARLGDKHHSGYPDTEYALPLIRVGDLRAARRFAEGER